MQNDQAHHNRILDDHESSALSDPNSVDDDALALVPARRWWLRRVGIVFGAIVILFSVLHVLVEFRSRALLESRVSQWKAAGQPVEPQDFNPTSTLPDAQNAAILYKKAAGLFTWPKDVDSSLDISELSDLHQYLNEARKVVAVNQPMLDLIRRASKLDNADWGLRVTSPIIGSIPASLSDARQCAKVSCLASGVALRDGDHIEAIRHLRDTIHLGNVLDRSAVTLIETFVSGAVVALAMSWIERNLEHISVLDHNGMTASDAEAQLRLLIDELLDEREQSQAFKRGLLYERASYLDTARLLADGTLSPSAIYSGPAAARATPIHHVWRVIARPIWRRDAVRCADRVSGLVAMDLSQPYQKNEALIPESDNEESQLEAAISPITVFLSTNFTSIIQHQYRSMAQRRMAACALAIRWFELKNGHRPEQLNELVPDFLPSIPIDPFDPNAGEIRYLPDTAPAKLYSVGPNQIDESGDDDLIHKGPLKSRRKDLVFLLDPKPESPAPEN